MSLVNNSANNFKDFLDAIKPYLNYQMYDLSGQGVEANNFSTDEKVIGTWVDGKPLYQKTWEFTNYVELSSTNWYTTNISNSNIQNIVYSKATNSGGTCWSVSANCDSGSYVQLLAIRDNSGFAIKYLTLQYTKTTDTAVASGEKIVGQWIDGKPVYEKTFTLSNTTKGSEVSIDASNLNISECVEIFGTYNRLVSNLTMTYMFNNFEGGVSPDLYYSMLRYDDTQKNIKYKIGLPGGEATNKQVITIRYTKTTD